MFKYHINFNTIITLTCPFILNIKGAPIWHCQLSPKDGLQFFIFLFIRGRQKWPSTTSSLWSQWKHFLHWAHLSGSLSAKRAPETQWLLHARSPSKHRLLFPTVHLHGPSEAVQLITTRLQHLLWPEHKEKLSLWQAVEAHRFVRRRGSHIF
jgi:hypothetical protein